MFNCLICKNIFTNQQSLSGHIRIVHKISKKEYYDSYIKSDNEDKCKTCGSVTNFRGNRYLTYCSSKCYNMCSDIKSKRKIYATDKKQSKETIEKRIQNTDQIQKENNRQNTMNEKYNDIFYFPNPENRNKKISESLSGKSHSIERHRKVIKSKRINGTIKHKESTKIKISKSLRRYYSDVNIDHCVTIPIRGRGGRGYLFGDFDGIYYRSSYELQFLTLCKKYNITVKSAATKEFRLKYEIDGKKKYYYPDFYLPNYDTVCEIKPKNLVDCEVNEKKIQVASSTYKFWLVTEKELIEENFNIGINYL